METSAQPIAVLDESAALEFLGSQSFGRLALVLAGRPDIFPVNFVLVGRTVYLRTAEGSKLFGLAVGHPVAFEADEVHELGATSVVVHGEPRIVTDHAEAEAADAAGLRPWVATRKVNTVAIDLTEVSGRAVLFGPEPEDAELEPTD
ncbi:pyridoxamine 5'-phosphate oxidase family protein [Galactobacter valiniphilus]|uniref:pyridoxamine 5'-phosphate oxidase family protein n=1 Tax=Galactobacter valiniphilus TaxID=2676122 RepID=UPI003734F9C3